LALADEAEDEPLDDEPDEDEPPEDEPDEDEPDEDEPDDDEPLDAAVPDAAFPSPDDLVSELLFVSLLPLASALSALAAVAPALALSSALAAPGLLYKSAYQPPPFSKNPVPPETRRFAFFSLHDTHVSSGRSLIDCSASHWWPQAWHTYS
jgi:hypothetical protein